MAAQTSQISLPLFHSMGFIVSSPKRLARVNRARVGVSGWGYVPSLDDLSMICAQRVP